MRREEGGCRVRVRVSSMYIVQRFAPGSGVGQQMWLLRGDYGQAED